MEVVQILKERRFDLYQFVFTQIPEKKVQNIFIMTCMKSLDSIFWIH